MEHIENFLRYFRFTDGIATSDIIGWILAAFAGILAYKLIDHMQTDIERHSILAEIERDLSKLYDSKIALKIEGKIELTSHTLKAKDKKQVMVRSVLHDDSPWTVIVDAEDSKEIQYVIDHNQRYIQIRNDENHNEWISTQALHDLLLKVRRIEKMYKGGIIKRIDLNDFYRELLPLATSGRLKVIKKYYGDYDAECIAYVVMQIIISCNKYKNEQALEYFKKSGDVEEDGKIIDDIEKVFKDNRRVRRIRDFGLFSRYKNIYDSIKIEESNKQCENEVESEK